MLALLKVIDKRVDANRPWDRREGGGEEALAGAHAGWQPPNPRHFTSFAAAIASDSIFFTARCVAAAALVASAAAAAFLVWIFSRRPARSPW